MKKGYDLIKFNENFHGDILELMYTMYKFYKWQKWN